MKVLSFLKPYRSLMVIAWILMLIELAVELAHPLLMAKVIDEGIVKNDMQMVMKWGSIMLLISLLAFIAGIINSFFSAKVSQGFGFDLRAAQFKNVQSFSFSTLAKYDTASLITRLTNDVTQVQNTIFMSLRIMLRAPLLVVGGLSMALLVNVKLALLFIVPLPFFLLLLIYIMKISRKSFQRMQQKLDRVNQVMQENLTGMKLIKVFLRAKYEERRFAKANERLREGTVQALRTIEITAPILLFVMNVSILAVLWFGAKQVHTEDLQIGEVVAIVNYGFRITSALSMLTFIIMAFSRGKASADRIEEVLGNAGVHEKFVSNKKVDVQLQGALTFDHVSFSYPESKKRVLEDITFSVRPGETVAVLGATGSGKSSLFSLIPRLYDATAGTISVDGINIKNINLAALRKQIGYVAQESILFTGTISDNIGWGIDNPTMDQVINAAKDAQIHDTIMSFPKQYETRVGQKGVNLSGGQKQRLSIARALIRKPRILLLDDSTSALDVRTEAKLLEALKKYECTMVMITQKITTASAADNILILEDGKVSAWGNHQQLLASSEMYQRIVTSQYRERGERHGS